MRRCCGTAVALLLATGVEHAGGLLSTSSMASSSALSRHASFLPRSTHAARGRRSTRRCGLGKAGSGRGRASSSTAATTMGIAYNPNDELRAIVQRKQHETKSLLAAHTASDDRLQMRLSYGASESCYALRSALRRNKGQEQDHQAVVVADMKRRSPTSAELPPAVNAFDDPAAWASQLHAAGASVLMVNTDGPAWGGSVSDLDKVVAHFKKIGKTPPPIVAKDVIVHPMQMAQALEKGAAGTVLIACVLGPALCDFMDAATMMGTECIVEVHTPAEVEKALEHGASVIMVNNWDRITGKLYPKQAMAVRHLIPDQARICASRVLTIASGGIDSVEQAGRLTDEGYDAVVLGRSLVSGASGPELIRGIVDRVGVPRSMLGWGVKAEDLDYDRRKM
ncbi:unnamed protein product [Ectocarpus sp. 13 AM-2016]